MPPFYIFSKTADKSFTDAILIHLNFGLLSCFQAYNAKISGFGTAKITRLSYFYEVHPNFLRNRRYVDAPPENVIPGAGAGNPSRLIS